MDFSFKKTFQSVLSSFAQKEDSVVGIDIGTSSIKVVQLKRKNGRAVLETYGALSLGTYAKLDVGVITNLENPVLTTALVDVIRESGVTTTSGAIAVPASASLVFIIDLPRSIDDKNMATIIPTEARKYIPVPINEVMLDYWAIPEHEESVSELTPSATPSDKREVLIAAIHNETISKYQDLMKSSNLSSSFAEIETFSAMRSTFSHELSTVLLIDFGASKTKLAVVEYGIIKSFHIVNRGSYDISNALSKSLSVPFAKAEEMKREFGLFGSSLDKSVEEITKLSVTYILNETSSVILAYEKKYNKTINKVILCGGGSLLKGFYDMARTHFTAPVEMGHPFAKVEAPAFLEPVLKETGPEFAVAIGLALRQLES
jgi:type IV pilus assembly protein PilM